MELIKNISTRCFLSEDDIERRLESNLDIVPFGDLAETYNVSLDKLFKIVPEGKLYLKSDFNYDELDNIDTMPGFSLSKYDMIVAEVSESGEEYPRITLQSSDGSEVKELHYNQQRKAWSSLLVFLIYERSNRGENGEAVIRHHGLRWLARLGTDFEPYNDVCRWFGYDLEADKLPGWWSDRFNLDPTISNVKKIFTENGIYDEMILRDEKIIKGSLFHLQDRLNANIVKR